MTTHQIYTENYDRRFQHGTVEVRRQDEYEATVDVKLDFTISRSTEDQMIEDIKALVQKYAI